MCSYPSQQTKIGELEIIKIACLNINIFKIDTYMNSIRKFSYLVYTNIHMSAIQSEKKNI